LRLFETLYFSPSFFSPLCMCISKSLHLYLFIYLCLFLFKQMCNLGDVKS
jgi:hypothetical protein